MLHETKSGTPQGGIISPLLKEVCGGKLPPATLRANIALDGLDNLLSQYEKEKIYQYAYGKKKRKYKKYGYDRYADDFIVTAKTKEDIEEITPIINEFLRERGLELSQDKTHITHVGKGLNFLGFHIRRYRKTIILPQKEKVLEKLQEIRAWLKKNKHATPEAVITYLNPIIRGFGNFYAKCSAKKVLSYFDTQIWKALWRWAQKRHRTQKNNWGKKKVKKKYFCRLKRQEWTFFAKTQDRRGKPKTIYLFRASSIPIEYHVKIKGTASPDDPALTKYWKDRQTKYGKSYWPENSKLRKIAENQQWKCPVCGEHLFNRTEGENEELHTHHIVQMKDGGTDETKNLIHLHKSCHQHLHSKGKKKVVKPELPNA